MGEERERTAWHCDLCHAEGVIEYDKHTLAYEVVYQIEDAHEAADHWCQLMYGVVKVRVTQVNSVTT